VRPNEIIRRKALDEALITYTMHFIRRLDSDVTINENEKRQLFLVTIEKNCKYSFTLTTYFSLNEFDLKRIESNIFITLSWYSP